MLSDGYSMSRSLMKKVTLTLMSCKRRNQHERKSDGQKSTAVPRTFVHLGRFISDMKEDSAMTYREVEE